jgi:hypothetical protein
MDGAGDGEEGGMVASAEVETVGCLNKMGGWQLVRIVILMKEERCGVGSGIGEGSFAGAGGVGGVGVVNGGGGSFVGQGHPGIGTSTAVVGVAGLPLGSYTNLVLMLLILGWWVMLCAKPWWAREG